MSKVACLVQKAINKDCIPIAVPCEGSVQAGTRKFHIWGSLSVIGINIKIIHPKYSTDSSKPARKDGVNPRRQALPNEIQALWVWKVYYYYYYYYYFNVYFPCFWYYLASFISKFLGSHFALQISPLVFPRECGHIWSFLLFLNLKKKRFLTHREWKPWKVLFS